MGRRDLADVPVHRLRRNDTVWSPPSVIFFDTETAWADRGKYEVHTLRLWAGVLVDRHRRKGKLAEPVWGWGDDRESFARWVDGRCVGRQTVWVYAHNLGFDLTVTALTETMPALGWRVKDFAVGAGAPFLRLGKGKKTLTLCDSWSWLPESLESLATRMGRHKTRLPDPDDPGDEWLTRCTTDVELLARSVLSLMGWWDEQKLGRWTISGAACGFNVMRHMDVDRRHVIVPDPDGIASDRAALRGGRKDAAVNWSTRDGMWVELDFPTAYPSVARELPLPTKRVDSFESMSLSTFRRLPEHLGVIAECTIRTDQPRYPVKHSGVTWYGVGVFRTTLAGPELRWALENGDLVRIGAGYIHRLGMTLNPWAEWVLDPSAGGAVAVPPVGQLFCRFTGRSTIGKFAAHGQIADVLEGPAPQGWSAGRLFDHRVMRRGAEVTMSGRRWLVTFDGDTENCYPAVTAWVESEIRVRLSKVLEATEGNWRTCDTDGLIVDLQNWRHWWRSKTVRLGKRPRDPLGAAEALCEALSGLTAPLKLRPKRTHESLRVLGPQHLVADDERRFSGVRRDSVEVEPGRFIGRDWPGLHWQMNNGAPGEYLRPERVSTFRAPTVHRWVMSDGATVPVSFALRADGTNHLLDWPESWRPDDAGALAPLQYHKLAPLV